MTMDEGMDEPVILRGVLYFLTLAAFFTIRYLLDVLLTPRLLDAVAHSLVGWVMEAPRTSMMALHSCSATLLPWAMLRAWRCLDAAVIERACLYVAGIQLGVKLIADNTLVMGRITKRDMWPLLVPLATFARVSSGRSRGPHRWRCGRRGLLCAVAPWLIRIWVLAALYTTVAAKLAYLGGQTAHASMDGEPQTGPSRWNACPVEEQAEGGCATFTGQPLPCHELRRAREFNRHVMPGMQHATYRQVRRAMTDHGLYGSTWHVGHACPDNAKKSFGDEEDHGWNLFAQHAADKVRLGHCLVSCAEAEYVGASSIPCAKTIGCLTECSGPNVHRV